MLNNLYNINEAVDIPANNSNISFLIEDYRTITEYLDVNITYRSNDYLNCNKNARGIWITPTQICFELFADDRLSIKQILFIKFSLPNNMTIHLQVKVDKLNDNIVIVNHATSSKHRTGPSTSTNYLVEFFANASSV